MTKRLNTVPSIKGLCLPPEDIALLIGTHHSSIEKILARALRKCRKGLDAGVTVR